MNNEIEELKNLLKYADISQSALAKQFKVSKMAVSKWLSGKSIPTKAKILHQILANIAEKKTYCLKLRKGQNTSAN